MKLMEHQTEVLKNISNGKILYGGVGTGKSITVLAYYLQKESPKDIYIITPAKKRDSLEWEGDAAKFGIGKKRAGTVAGVLHVDSWNNIGKYVDVEDAFFIFDEQRLVGSGEWVKAFQKIAKKNAWLMLTATPGDTWMDYAPVFIANGLYRHITEFKREHVVYAPFSRYPKIVRYTGTATLEKYRNMLLVEMPYKRHTVRNVQEVETTYDTQKFWMAFAKRWHPYEGRPIKDVGELFRVMRRIVNSDPSRLTALRELMAKHPKVIVYYNFDYELEALRSLAKEITIAEWNGHKHQQIPKTEKWVYIVQYVSGAEAWNCIETDAMVFYSMTYSYKNFEQAQGRIDRLNTPFTDLWYYIFASNSVIDNAIRGSLENKKVFNEREWATENGLNLG
jgi:hypothetical protein